MKRVLATMLCLATASVAMAGEWVFVTITSDDSKEAHVIAYDCQASSELTPENVV